MSAGAPINRTIWLTTAVFGVTLAIAGFHHGLFEALQGSHPTGGIGIHSIGPEHVRWEFGTDDAITIIPNFLLTGVVAMGVSLVIIAWSAFGLPTSNGPSVFLTLFIVLTLVGGGIGHVLFFLAVWAYATRIRAGLAWWRRRMGSRTRAAFVRAWPYALFLSSLLFLIALELSVFGFPPMDGDPQSLLALIWSVLIGSFLLLNLAYVGAIARDLGRAGAG